MTTVKKFIEYLKDIPLDTEIRVVVIDECGYSISARFETLNIDPLSGNVNYTDLANNPFVKEDSPNFDKRFLDLGLDR